MQDRKANATFQFQQKEKKQNIDVIADNMQTTLFPSCPKMKQNFHINYFCANYTAVAETSTSNKYVNRKFWRRLSDGNFNTFNVFFHVLSLFEIFSNKNLNKMLIMRRAQDQSQPSIYWALCTKIPAGRDI